MSEKIMEIQSEIIGLKQLLAATDYKALKHADGAISDEDYEPVRMERQKLRDEINRKEQELEEMQTE